MALACVRNSSSVNLSPNFFGAGGVKWGEGTEDGGTGAAADLDACLCSCFNTSFDAAADEVAGLEASLMAAGLEAGAVAGLAAADAVTSSEAGCDAGPGLADGSSGLLANQLNGVRGSRGWEGVRWREMEGEGRSFT